MKTIQIVKNSDRCHVSVNSIPHKTFIYSNYPEKDESSKQAHALHDAKAECFIQLAFCQRIGEDAAINTDIVTK